MKIIITIVIIFYTLTAGVIGWAVHDSTPPKIIYEKSTDECQNVLSTKECEDNSVIKESLTTCTNKLKTVKDCREKESKLADEVKDLKNKYNF